MPSPHGGVVMILELSSLAARGPQMKMPIPAFTLCYRSFWHDCDDPYVSLMFPFISQSLSTSTLPSRCLFSGWIPLTSPSYPLMLFVDIAVGIPHCRRCGRRA